MSRLRNGLVASGLLVVAATAFGHVTLEPALAPAGSYVRATLRVPHGCNGSPTVRIRVRVPDGALSVKPQAKPGWQVAVTRSKLAQPLDDGHGGKITETVSEVSWSGGRLLDENFDEFGIVLRTPDRAGTTLYFPVVQDCEQGTHRWIEIPEPGKGAGDYREPAPAMKLSPK